MSRCRMNVIRLEVAIWRSRSSNCPAHCNMMRILCALAFIIAHMTSANIKADVQFGKEFVVVKDRYISPIFDIAGDGSDQFLIAWNDAEHCLYRFFSLAKLKVSSIYQVEQQNLIPYYPSVSQLREISFAKTAVFQNENFLVCWSERKHELDDTYSENLYGQLFRSDAQKIGDEFKINPDGLMASNYGISAFSNNDFIVTFQSFDPVQKELAISFSLFNSDGKIIHRGVVDNRIVEPTSHYGLVRPSAAVLQDDSFAVRYIIMAERRIIRILRRRDWMEIHTNRKCANLIRV